MSMYVALYNAKTNKSAAYGYIGIYNNETAARQALANWRTSQGTNNVNYDTYIARPYVKVVPKDVPTYDEPVEF
jgi:hypothetical protein